MQTELILRNSAGERVVKTFDTDALAESFLAKANNPSKAGRPPIKVRVWFEDGKNLLFESVGHFADYAGVNPAQVSYYLGKAKLDHNSKIPCPVARMTKYWIAREDTYQEFLSDLKSLRGEVHQEPS